MFFTRIDAEQEGDKIVQTTLTNIPIHYISSWSPSYEASQKLGLQLYENIDQNSIFLFLSWLTPNRASTDLYSLPKKTNMSCEALVTNILTFSISAPCCLLLSYLITLETTDSLSSYLTYSLTPACRSVFMFAGTYSCYDRYDVGNTCGSFFMAQNITSLSYSDQQASICEEYANLSTILAK